MKKFYSEYHITLYLNFCQFFFQFKFFSPTTKTFSTLDEFKMQLAKREKSDNELNYIVKGPSFSKLRFILRTVGTLKNNTYIEKKMVIDYKKKVMVIIKMV